MMELMGRKDPTMPLRYTQLFVEYKRLAVQELPTLQRGGYKSPRNSPQEEEPKLVRFAR